MNLQSFTLQIFEPKQTIAFYTNVLGFIVKEEFTQNNSTFYNLYQKDAAFHIQLQYNSLLEKKTYQQKPTDNYWKYSLFVDDIQKVYKELRQQQYSVGEPYQFGDIGYLAHTKDTENHQIEFIQKTFKQNSPIKISSNSFKESETALGLLTIRTKDPLKSIRFYEEILDLKLFVRMYVDRGNGFTLYFLGAQNLTAPNPDIDAIENREWMYQQRHLFIEIQYYWNTEQDEDFSLHTTPQNGLRTINFLGDITVLKEKLIRNNTTFSEENDHILFETPDKHQILVRMS